MRNHLEQVDICNNIDTTTNGDPEKNYTFLSNTLTQALKKFLPTKTVRYHKHKHKNSPWITQGIIKSIKYRDTLYLSLIKLNKNTTKYASIKNNLDVYNKILKNTIRKAKKQYYYLYLTNTKVT